MRCLAEEIARQANQEDGVTGRFFQGRFKSQQLLDETAVLACAIYVDLNPIRAALAATPETSEFTSAYVRIQARQRRQRQRLARQGHSERVRDLEDHWLSPVELARSERNLPSISERRASDRGFLPLTEDQYLELLDWTGRQVRSDKRGSIPSDLAPILERLQVSTNCWVDLIAGLRKQGSERQRSVGGGRLDKRCAGSGDALPPSGGALPAVFLHA